MIFFAVTGIGSSWYVVSGDVTGHVISQDIGLTNGILHVIDVVMDDLDEPNTGDWVMAGSAGPTTDMTSAVIAVSAAMFVYKAVS